MSGVDSDFARAGLADHPRAWEFEEGSVPATPEVLAMVTAVKWARFFIGCQMDGIRHDPKRYDPTGEGVEIGSEVLAELCAAVAPFAPDQMDHWVRAGDAEPWEAKHPLQMDRTELLHLVESMSMLALDLAQDLAFAEHLKDEFREGTYRQATGKAYGLARLPYEAGTQGASRTPGSAVGPAGDASCNSPKLSANSSPPSGETVTLDRDTFNRAVDVAAEAFYYVQNPRHRKNTVYIDPPLGGSAFKMRPVVKALMEAGLLRVPAVRGSEPEPPAAPVPDSGGDR